MQVKLKYVAIFAGVLALSVGITWFELRRENVQNAPLGNVQTPAEIAQKEAQYASLSGQMSSSSAAAVADNMATTSASASAQTASAEATLRDEKNGWPPQLSFDEMNQQYGPCAVVPTLFYHHIQNIDQAKAAGHAQFTVSDGWFHRQMQYLKDHNYTVIRMQDLISFFDHGTALPKKPVLITVDDGYDDFAVFAVPILQEFGFPATMFTPTGLIENPGYLTWNTIQQVASGGLVEFANHTWSHHNMQTSKTTIEKEISSAETALASRGYDTPKVFAYPYGFASDYAKKYLQSQGYQLAFTTQKGDVQCKQLRMALPRYRIGNFQLNGFGM